MKNDRKYLRADEANAMGLYSKKDLKVLFRLKPARGQLSSGMVWQGQGAYEVYNKELCVPMRPYRAPSDAQLAALAAGRECIGTLKCKVCTQRYDPCCTQNNTVGLCDPCESKQRRSGCVEQVQEWFADGFYVLDVESTGLGDDARIVEIAVINSTGETLLNTLVNPCCPIPAEATQIHGITDADVAEAPLWPDVCNMLEELLLKSPKPVVIYNSAYDCRLIEPSSDAHGHQAPQLHALCAMLVFSRWYGEVSYGHSYRWQSLALAAHCLDVSVQGEHRALADCLTTLGVLKALGHKKPAPFK